MLLIIDASFLRILRIINAVIFDNFDHDFLGEPNAPQYLFSCCFICIYSGTSGLPCDIPQDLSRLLI